jgi:hypothetical protein
MSGMAGWRIEIEIGGVDWGSEDLARLADVLERFFPHLGATCALRSGNLAVTVIAEPPTPPEALRDALAAISSAFDFVALDQHRASEILSVNMAAERAPHFAVATD